MPDQASLIVCTLNIAVCVVANSVLAFLLLEELEMLSMAGSGVPLEATPAKNVGHHGSVVLGCGSPV